MRICYLKCTTCTCEIICRGQSLFLLKQLLIFIQNTERKNYFTCAYSELVKLETAGETELQIFVSYIL